MELKINTLKQIDDAIQASVNAQEDGALTADERSVLDDAINKLEELHQCILRCVEDDMITTLSKNTAPLQKIIDDLTKQSEKVDAAAQAITKVANTIAALTTIISTATKAGLI